MTTIIASVVEGVLAIICPLREPAVSPGVEDAAGYNRDMAYQAVGSSTWTRALARLAVLGVSGCSLLYNPDNIPSIDGKPPIDAPRPLDGRPDAEMIIDANPAAVTVTDFEPSAIFEGTGDGSSRPEVLVVHGDNFVTGATVTLAEMGGSGSGSAMPALEILDDPAIVSADHHTLAVRVIAHVDTTLAAGSTRMFAVEVTEPAGGSSASASGSAMLIEQGLAELIGSAGSAIPLSGTATYSLVDITNGSITVSGSNPIIVRSTSSITVKPAVTVSATSTTVPGPAGNAPGAGSGAGGPGSSGGGGGGYGTKGGPGGGANGGTAGSLSGDPLISSYGSNASSGGGAGAAVGGAGGGTVELTAAGTLSVGTITSIGAAGSNAALTGGGGGGGTGGTIVLRGTTVTTGTLTVTGGSGGTGGILSDTGGTGGDGRIRIDLSSTTFTPPTDGHQGLYFDNSIADTVLTTSTPSLQIDGAAGDKLALYVLDSSGNLFMDGTNMYTYTIGLGQNVMATPTLPDAVAYQLCLTPVLGSFATAEATNCIHVAYVPQ
jgi:hypothetical protein